MVSFGRRWDISRRNMWKEKLRRLKGPLVKKSVESLKEEHLTDKKVLVKVDLDVQLNDDFTIRGDDYSRIRDALPTINYIISRNASVILLSHRGFPINKEGEQYSLKPFVQILSQLLKVQVIMADGCIGDEVKVMIHQMPSRGGVLLLENVRFNAGEMACDQEFAKQLASLAHYYVNDCFRVSYRTNASNLAITQYIPSVAGLLMKKELKYLFEDLGKVMQPFHAIVGGSRLSTRIGVIRNLFDNGVRTIFFGGGLIFTFLAATGCPVGNSLVEDDMLHQANLILIEAKESGVDVVLPSDIVIADWFADSAETEIVKYGNAIKEGFIGLDIGSSTVGEFSKELDKAKTIIWNGPMGAFEIAKFAHGTKEIAKKLAEVEATTIIVGSSTVTAVKKWGLEKKMTHVSTGGIASLELLEGIPPCGILALEDEDGRSKVLRDRSDDEVDTSDDEVMMGEVGHVIL